MKLTQKQNFRYSYVFYLLIGGLMALIAIHLLMTSGFRFEDVMETVGLIDEDDFDERRESFYLKHPKALRPRSYGMKGVSMVEDDLDPSEILDAGLKNLKFLADKGWPILKDKVIPLVEKAASFGWSLLVDKVIPLTGEALKWLSSTVF